jgi:hypothetical protein
MTVRPERMTTHSCNGRCVLHRVVAYVPRRDEQGDVSMIDQMVAVGADILVPNAQRDGALSWGA